MNRPKFSRRPYATVHSVFSYCMAYNVSRAARSSCLPGLRRGGGGRLAGATVLSCLVMTAGQVRLAPECVRRSQCAARHIPTQARRRTHLSGCRADLVHTATPDTTKQSCLCRVWCDGVNWTIAINVFKLQIFYRRQSRVAGQFTPLKRARHRQDSFVVSGVVV